MNIVNRKPIKLWLAGIFIVGLLWLTCFKVQQFQRDNAFFAAIEHNDVVQARELVEHGARWQTLVSKLHQLNDTPNRNKLASTALQVALEYHYDSSMDSNTALPEDVALAQNLFDVGAHATSDMLFLAASQNKRATVRLLLQNGANVKVKALKTKTPLMEVAYYGDTEMINAFLDKGANINAIDELRWTPLMQALWSEQVEAVRLLLKRHANPNCVYTKDNYGATFLSKIEERPQSPEKIQIMKMLRQSGVTK